MWLKAVLWAWDVIQAVWFWSWEICLPLGVVVPLMLLCFFAGCGGCR